MKERGEARIEVGNLELTWDAGGLRHVQGEKAVSAGTTLELLLEDGKGTLGRYKWTTEGDSLPRLTWGLAGVPPGPPTDEGALPLPTWAILRGPGGGEK